MQQTCPVCGEEMVYYEEDGDNWFECEACGHEIDVGIGKDALKREQL